MNAKSLIHRRKWETVMSGKDYSGISIVVVDNGGQWTHREYRVIRDIGAGVKIVPNTADFSQIAAADGMVLSGGSPSVGLQPERMGNAGRFVDLFRGPILGICVGHHFLAQHLGGKVGRGLSAEYGRARLEVIESKGILAGLPPSFTVWESHKDEVKALPPGFVSLARTGVCEIEAMMSTGRKIFGVQFHPEVNDTENGPEMFINFLEVVSEWKSAGK
jgi:GMP synthase (glutamine-hydrolysing)